MVRSTWKGFNVMAAANKNKRKKVTKPMILSKMNRARIWYRLWRSANKKICCQASVIGYSDRAAGKVGPGQLIGTLKE